MKKTVKSLIIAASVAAIAGIGAVSFAAWNGTVNSQATSNSTALGSITVNAGFITTDAANPVDLEFTGDTELMPWDQSGTLATGQTKQLVADIPAYQVKAGTYTFKLTTDLDSDSEIVVYYQVGATAATASDPTADGTAWIAAGTATDDITAAADGEVAAGAQKLTIIIASSDLGSMETEITYTLTLVQA